MFDTLPQLIRAYLDSLKGRACYRTKVHTASEWMLHLSAMPTRKEILARHLEKGKGHYQPGSCQANMELGLLRAACRWGIYQEVWNCGDPTIGIKKWKRPKRVRTGKYDELRKLLLHFDEAKTELEIRDRALFGLMLFTGCRPSEARRCKLDAITPYGEMGSWVKGVTKTGQPQELPLPTQLMPWLAAWYAIRTTERPNVYLFPGQDFEKPISSELVRYRWSALRKVLDITGLWNYDIRRTLVCILSNNKIVKQEDSTVMAIINHADTTAMGHYRFKDFDSLTHPIQVYADWLWSLKQPVARTPAPSIFHAPLEQEVRA
jgi:integrase